MNWLDKSYVIIISSEFRNAINEYRARSGKLSAKPESLLNYNKFMRGVERSDQLMSYTILVKLKH